MVFAAKASEAAKVLGVELDGLTPDAVSKAYRSKAKTCHPDIHGTAKLADWARLDWANKVMDQWLKQNPAPKPSTEIANAGTCRACDGTGRVKLNSGGFGRSLTMICVLCAGSGTVDPKEIDSE